VNTHTDDLPDGLQPGCPIPPTTSQRALAPSHLARWRGQAGEGVISTAIAVLVMAFIGAAMWLAFSGTFDRASDRVDEQIGRIGDDY
jgi:hypothetical protein